MISDEEGGQDEPNEEEERRELGDRESEGLVHGEGSTAHGGAGFQVTWGGPPGRPQAGRVGGLEGLTDAEDIGSRQPERVPNWAVLAGSF